MESLLTLSSKLELEERVCAAFDDEIRLDKSPIRKQRLQVILQHLWSHLNFPLHGLVNYSFHLFYPNSHLKNFSINDHN